MKIVRDVQYGEFSQNTMDLYLPERGGYETVVYFHGGGIESGDKAEKNYTEIAEDFVKNGYAFVSANYRMYTDGARFPQFLEDGARSVAWVKTHIKDYGGNGALYISGQSAGAWMSMLLCLDEKYLQSVGISPMEIKGWMIDSAQMTAHFNVLKYECVCDPRLERINEYAPLYYLNSDTKFNKMLLLFYDHDIPCRLEQNMLFIKSVERICKGVDLQYRLLPGTHVRGSCVREDDGEYAFVREAMRWLKE